MALARVKTWNPGDVLTAADLNGEFNNVLNNPITLVSPTTGPINFNLQTHTNLIPAAISATSGSTGQALIVSSSGGAVFGNNFNPAISWVRNLAGTLSSVTGQFTADQYLLQTTDGLRTFLMNSTALFTVNIGTAGPAANGRDIAGNFGSTYVHWYMITTGFGSTTVAGIVSTATPPSGPVLPAGYSAWVYLGCSMYSSSSTSLSADHRFQGHEAHYLAGQQVLTNGNTTAANTAVPIGLVVPSNAKRYMLQISYVTADPSVQSVTISHVSGSNYSINVISASALSGPVMRFIPMPATSTQFFYTLSTGFAAANDSLQGHVLSYTMPNGDV